MSIISLTSVSCLTTTGFLVIISMARTLPRFLPCLIARKISTAVTIPITLALLSITGRPLKSPTSSTLSKNTNSDLLHQLVEYLVIHQWSLQFQNLLSLRNNHYTSKHYLHNDLPLLDQLSLLLVPMSQPH